ncbi:hypothetical protein BLA9940_00114 [Burkholderia aenigmatica]|uniref:hypothetical protein n=1 Tax=Burkholderia cepacia complex TaxID=87882 RepID=UPI0013DE209B|nr:MULTISPECIES: hypothetical protein [Burkholderia cepacia complex]VWC31820.1 hypothetical protein BLA9940_00114 [Burkholderia aenigmatica]
MQERNLEQGYDTPDGPSYEYLINVKGQSPQDIIAGATRSNKTIDILTGIAKVK